MSYKKQYVFWSYDAFPFCLGAEVDVILPDGRVQPKGYGGQVKIKEPLLVLPLQDGIELHEKLHEIEDAKRVTDRIFATTVRDLIKDTAKKRATEG